MISLSEVWAGNPCNERFSYSTCDWSNPMLYERRENHNSTFAFWGIDLVLVDLELKVPAFVFSLIGELNTEA